MPDEQKKQFDIIDVGRNFCKKKSSANVAQNVTDSFIIYHSKQSSIRPKKKPTETIFTHVCYSKSKYLAICQKIYDTSILLAQFILSTKISDHSKFF